LTAVVVEFVLAALMVLAAGRMLAARPLATKQAV
jgi:hypothetical protein